MSRKPVSPEKRLKVCLSILVNEQTATQLRMLAELEHQDISEYVRNLILRHLLISGTKIQY